MERFREARREAETDPGNPEQLEVHRQLAEACPAFTQNLLFLAWRLLRANGPEEQLEDRLAEIQRLLERAVQGSYRSAPAVVELGYFLDTYRNAPHEAARLYEEAGAKALETVRDSWRGLIRYWNDARTKETLEKALKLGELAEKMFPDYTPLMLEVHTTREYAALDGLLSP
ncbi:hypothetical protein [Archangium sp. Cb G35]|uniref:hypothetical protein n=1 Tax=Archangium sp. Cb G35 TaxID=1920190 RepID=UPI001160E682|nr:hypothetical protein [Archangium sp. Cb G35]